MIFFKHRKSNKYLVTNLKVMSSSLADQDSLISAKKSFSLLVNIQQARFKKTSPFYLITRNPYQRIESFFKNKFRTTLPNITKNKRWQYCHEIFFNDLQLTKYSSAEQIVDRLKNTTFEEFITILPTNYKKDGHIYPQHFALQLKFAFISLPIRYQKIYKIEQQEDMKTLSNLFSLDMSTIHNSTKYLDVEIDWTNEMLQIVNQLYRKDFETFQYSIRKSTNDKI